MAMSTDVRSRLLTYYCFDAQNKVQIYYMVEFVTRKSVLFLKGDGTLIKVVYYAIISVMSTPQI